jgi:hypothetical protein
LREGPRFSETCSRDVGKEYGPKSGSREADREDQDPRAGNPKDGSNSSRGASSAVEGRSTRREDLKERLGAFSSAGTGRNTRKDDLKERRGAFSNAVEGRNTRKDDLKEARGAARAVAAAVRRAAPVSAKIANVFN